MDDATASIDGVCGTFQPGRSVNVVVFVSSVPTYLWGCATRDGRPHWCWCEGSDELSCGVPCAVMELLRNYPCRGRTTREVPYLQLLQLELRPIINKLFSGFFHWLSDR